MSDWFLFLILLSLLALLAGALCALLLAKNGWGVAALKGLMASVLGGFLLFELWPEVFERLGWISVGLGALGFLSITSLEKVFKHNHDDGGRFFTAELVWVGLLIHQLTDGIGLALAAQEGSALNGLAIIVIAHRLPVAAVVMWVFISQRKAGQGWLRVAGMGLATLIGAFGSHLLVSFIDGVWVNGVLAFVSGTFLHLFAHDFMDFHAHRSKDKMAEFFAFLVGVAFLVLVFSQGDHQAHQHDMTFFKHFEGLLLKSAPYLLLGLAAGGLLYRFLPESPIRWMQRGRPFTQSVKGMVFGLPLPVCSCGVLPLFTSLAKRGLPPAALVSFLIATPELGVDSFLFSMSLLGWKFSVLRLVVAILLPILAAILFVQWYKRMDPIEETKSCCAKESHGPQKSAWRYATVDMVDDIFPMILFGLLIAALAQTLWPLDQNPLPQGWDVLLLGILGIPFYVCASASVPLALVFLERGFSLGAVLVFLFAGPATNMATILTVNKTFGKRSGWTLAFICLGLALVMGFLSNLFLPAENFLPAAETHAEHGSWFAYACVGALVLLALGSWWRSGPLHWISSLAQIIPGVVHHPKLEEDHCH